MLDKDMETISSCLRTYLKEDKRVLDSPSPSVTASNLTDKGVEFLVQAWTKTEDADAVRNDFVSHSLSAVQTATNTASVLQRL
jgi:small-conductance mechanosensitive channel